MKELKVKVQERKKILYCQYWAISLYSLCFFKGPKEIRITNCIFEEGNSKKIYLFNVSHKCHWDQTVQQKIFEKACHTSLDKKFCF